MNEMIGSKERAVYTPPLPLFRRMVSSGTLMCNKVEALIFSELVSCALYDCLMSFVSP